MFFQILKREIGASHAEILLISLTKILLISPCLHIAEKTSFQKIVFFIQRCKTLKRNKTLKRVFNVVKRKENAFFIQRCKTQKNVVKRYNVENAFWGFPLT